MINHNKTLKPGMVALLGIQLDENSTFMSGPSEAPDIIRKTLHSGSSNLCAENGVDLSNEPRFTDLGNFRPVTGPAGFNQITAEISNILDCQAKLLVLGGDHSITYPIFKAYKNKYQTLNILHFDAHPDLYDEYEGNRHSHACPFARIMENCPPNHLVQVGIRTMTPHLRSQAERFDVKSIDMDQNPYSPDFDGPVYLSLDLDVLDPAFAPGVSHHEPGGLSTRDVLKIIHSVRAPIVGADIVELNPKRDPSGITAMAASKFLKEIAGHMIRNN